MKKVNALFLLIGLLLLVLGIHEVCRYVQVALPILDQYPASQAVADLVHHDGIQAVVEIVAGILSLTAAFVLPRVKKQDL